MRTAIPVRPAMDPLLLLVGVVVALAPATSLTEERAVGGQLNRPSIRTKETVYRVQVGYYFCIDKK